MITPAHQELAEPFTVAHFCIWSWFHICWSSFNIAGPAKFSRCCACFLLLATWNNTGWYLHHDFSEIFSVNCWTYEGIQLYALLSIGRSDFVLDTLRAMPDRKFFIRKLLKAYPNNWRLLISLRYALHKLMLYLHRSSVAIEHPIILTYHACRISDCVTSMSMLSGMAMHIGHQNFRFSWLLYPTDFLIYQPLVTQILKLPSSEVPVSTFNYQLGFLLTCSIDFFVYYIWGFS